MDYNDPYRIDIVLTRIPYITPDGTDGRAPLPRRATCDSSGYDITAFCPERPVEIRPLEICRIRTGLIFALPVGATFLVCSRSGLASKGLQVINAPGIIDSDYRDEVGVLLTYIAPPEEPPFVITHGMRIAQLLYLPAPSMSEARRAYPYFHEVSEHQLPPVGDSTRHGGFGSTGVDALT
jgi:dUTP pyrophosphatase